MNSMNSFDKGYVSAETDIWDIIFEDGLKGAIRASKRSLVRWVNKRNICDYDHGAVECIMDFIDRHDPKWLGETLDSMT